MGNVAYAHPPRQLTTYPSTYLKAANVLSEVGRISTQASPAADMKARERIPMPETIEDAHTRRRLRTLLCGTRRHSEHVSCP